MLKTISLTHFMYKKCFKIFSKIYNKGEYIFKEIQSVNYLMLSQHQFTGFSPLTKKQKMNLSPSSPTYPSPHCFAPPPPLSRKKNVYFVLFMQFLAILPKISPTSLTQLGNPSIHVQCLSHMTEKCLWYCFFITSKNQRENGIWTYIKIYCRK